MLGVVGNPNCIGLVKIGIRFGRNGGSEGRIEMQSGTVCVVVLEVKKKKKKKKRNMIRKHVA